MKIKKSRLLLNAARAAFVYLAYKGAVMPKNGLFPPGTQRSLWQSAKGVWKIGRGWLKTYLPGGERGGHK